MDLADLADEATTVITEATIASIVQQAKPKTRSTCDCCGEPLETFRMQFGRCYDCQDRLEKTGKLHG